MSTIVQLPKNFPTVYATHNLTVVFLKACHWSPIKTDLIQPTPFHTITLKCNLLLFFHLHLYLPSVSLPCLSGITWRSVLRHKSSYVLEKPSAFIIKVEAGGKKSSWKPGKFLQDQVASHPILIRLHNHCRGNLRYSVLLSGPPPPKKTLLTITRLSYALHDPPTLLSIRQVGQIAKCIRKQARNMYTQRSMQWFKKQAHRLNLGE